MPTRHVGSVRVLTLLLAGALAGACSGDDGTVFSSGVSSSTAITPASSSTTGATVPAEEPAFAYTIDPSLASGEGVEVMAAGGITARFAAQRVVVVFDDPAELEGIVARCGGTVIHRYSTADYGLPGPSVAVVEVDPAATDLASLPMSMTALGAQGEAAFGSEAGARTTACAAAERATGHRVSLDWIAAPTSIPDSTLEQEFREVEGWSRDAYQLSYYQEDAVQGFGVAEAWSLMYYAGALDNRVPIAILDTGFLVDEDFRDPATHTMEGSSVTFGEPSDGIYHGYLTASTALAVPDNEYGVAGVAGVVAEPILIQVAGFELSEQVETMLQAYSMGARIISMSFIAPVLADAVPLADALDEVTASLAAAGVLMFASAGNGGGNVDEVVAAGGSVAGTRPCQAPGVICVGGVDWDSVERHPDSTYGDPGGSVDLYTPYCVWLFPPNLEGGMQRVCGTSISAPFAAGVAALVWASDPELTGDEVWGLMESTLQGDRWPRADALAAVAEALGSFGRVAFLEPAEGSTHDLNTAVTLAAEVLIPTDPAVSSAEVRVRFSSDRDGLLDDDTWTVPMQHDVAVSQQRVSAVVVDLSEGIHAITVTINYGDTEATDTRRITVGNSPPSDLRILRPAEGERFCVGTPVLLRGDAYDINEQLGLAESAFRWRSNLDGLVGTGRNATATGLSVGAHRITLRVTDSGGLDATETVNIEVIAASHPDCSDLPPQAVIVEPSDGDDFWVDDTDPGVETGTDEYGDYLVVRLSVSVSDDHDAAGALQIDWYVRPERPDTWAGSGPEVEVRLHLQAGIASQVKEISVVIYDSAGNMSTDAIEVSVNRFM